MSKAAYYPFCERKHVVTVHDNGLPCAQCAVEDLGAQAPAPDTLPAVAARAPTPAIPPPPSAGVMDEETNPGDPDA